MSIRSVKNQYRGINAHLHSFWQGTGTWNRFHNVHVADLMKSMKAQLLPMGYTAEIEESLQIRWIGDDPRRPRADVLISDLESQPSTGSRPKAFEGALAVAFDALLEMEEDVEHPYSAIGVYERSSSSGEPIAWIELLSPSNKEGSDFRTYDTKRLDVVRSGMTFVEIDYLQETAPTFRVLPDYSRQDRDAMPYRITVLDPDTKLAHLYQFGVDSPLPKVAVPLNAGDILLFDFGVPYGRTFEDALYGYDMDYTQLPMNFDRYSVADQTRIAARMLAVLEAAKSGIDLETGPFVTKDIPLEDALKQIEALKEALAKS